MDWVGEPSWFARWLLVLAYVQWLSGDLRYNVNKR